MSWSTAPSEEWVDKFEARNPKYSNSDLISAPDATGTIDRRTVKNPNGLQIFLLIKLFIPIELPCGNRIFHPTDTPFELFKALFQALCGAVG